MAVILALAACEMSIVSPCSLVAVPSNTCQCGKGGENIENCESDDG